MGWLSSLNKERKRTPVHKFISKNLFKGAHAHEKPERDLEAEYQSMNDYVLYGPQEGGRTYSQRELREGPAYTLENSSGDDMGQVHGTSGEFGWEGQREGETAFDDKYYNQIEIPEGSWLASQMMGNTGPSPQVSGASNLGVSGLSPQFGQYTPPPQMNQAYTPESSLDFSLGNPFSKYAKQVGLKDFSANTNSMAGAMPGSKPMAGQIAQATALRGGDS